MVMPLTILMVEDSESDAQLIVRLLKKAGYEISFEQVQTAEQMRAALEERTWDVVISDYNLPQFDGRAALELLKETGQDIPFIIVSGVIGEESAVAMMKAGAHDYLMKSNLARLVPAVARELEQAQDRRERKQAEDELIKAKEKAEGSEEKFKAITNQATEGIALSDLDGNYVFVNPAFCKMTGYSEEELLKMTVFDVKAKTQPHSSFFESKTKMEGLPIQVNLQRKDGTEFYTEIVGRVIKINNKDFVLGTVRDISERKQAEEALKKSEERYALTLAAVNNGLWDWHIPSGNAFFSVLYYAILGYKDKAFPATYDSWRLLVHPEDIDRVESELRKSVESSEGFAIDLRMKMESGEWRWVSTRGKAVEKDAEGRALRMVGTLTDITERKQAEDQLRQLSRAVEQNPSSIIITDMEGKIEYVNPKFTELTGYTLEEIHKQNPRILQSGKTPPEVYKDLWQKLLSGKEWRGEFLNRKKNGELYWEFASISALTNSKGNITHFIAVKEDITARKEADEKIQRLNTELEELAMTDYLTNLYNRRYFMQRGTEEFKRAQRSNQPLSLLMMDINEFKSVNDNYGHEAGDAAIKQVAAVLKSNLREIDILGRIGGDEFAVLLPNTLLQDAVLSAERIRRALADQSVQVSGEALTFTVSIGVAVYRNEMESIDDMLRNADAAMYQAKRNGS
jgi:diguanylate cyclase (GGDEF)-like protein/PAS domain S-box-containing protein